ncbi:LPS-assembly protein LptD [Aestuariivirga sp.]|uniref:LPS-assembly protein LptD n=1 Tax=Aestuariivirga sp. TaxID=2650926 RepID=UPI003BA99794
MAAAGLGLTVPSSLARIADQPAFVAPEDKPIPKGTRVDVIAERLTYDANTKVATATGTVQLTYGPYILTATRVAYNMKSGTFEANGSVILKEPNGNILEADSAQLRDTFKEGFANHVKALLTNNVTITAIYAKRYENGVTIYQNASYTACQTCVTEDGVPIWQIVAREAKHDLNTHTIYYKDVSLKLGDVPVLWAPRFAYPDPTVKRRTGFLIPSYHSGDFGFGVATPYFWAIKPNMDLTLSPMWTTRRGVLADAEFRHRLSSGTYSIAGYGIYETSLSKSNETGSPWRGGARTQGDFKINDNWDWGWDGTVVSDRKFLSDYDIDSRNMLASYVQATGLNDRNYTKAQIIGWQTLVKDQDQSEMPIATPFVTGDYVLGTEVLGGEFSYGFNAYSLERRSSVDEPQNGIELGTEQSHFTAYADWKRQMISQSGLLVTPFAGVRSDAYYSENVPGASSDEDSEFDLTPTAGIDTRMPFVASFGTLQSVLTPVAQIIASPSEPNQHNNANEDAITLNFDTSNLFLSDRFTGYDRWEGGLRANAGVNYTLMAESGSFLRATFGESFHIAGENSFLAGSGLDGTASDLVAGVALQLTPSVTLGYQARMEEDLSRINVQEASLGLNFGKFSGSFNYADISAAANYGRPDNEQQVWADARYYLNNAWSVFGGFRYDIQNDKPMDEKMGVTFDCDCMKADLTYSMSHTDQFGVSDNGTEYRIDLSVELRTIGVIAGGFQL